MGVYVQEIPDSVRVGVEALDTMLFAKPGGRQYEGELVLRRPDGSAAQRSPPFWCIMVA
jgi:hypothetical protein